MIGPPHTSILMSLIAIIYLTSNLLYCKTSTTDPQTYLLGIKNGEFTASKKYINTINII